ncbi:MAG: hypothetical protein AAFQ83_00765 [Bacteroidota bacterium]
MTKSFTQWLGLAVLCAMFSCTPGTDSTATADNGVVSPQLHEQTEEETLQVSEVVGRLVAPPLDDVRVPTETVTFQTGLQETQEKALSSGTILRIQDARFVDAQQQPIEGAVDIQVKEFMDVADILMSGITMRYDSGDTDHILQSAGMIEVRANHNGQPVFMADGAEIEIDLATGNGADGYNLYYLDEQNAQNWSFIRTSTAEVNPAFAAREAQKKKTQPLPLKPRKLRDDAISFEFATDYNRYPSLAPYKGIVWQWAGKTTNNTLNPEKEQWIFGEKWERASVEEQDGQKGIFILTLRRSGKSARLLVTPALEGKDFDEAMATYRRIKKEQKAMKKRQQESYARQSEFIRSFSINQMGIYNYDRILKMQNRAEIMASFNFDAMSDYEPGTVSEVYLIMEGDNSVVQYPRQQWDRFMLSSDAKNQLIAILPGNRIAVFDQEDFKRAQPWNFDSFEFKFKDSGKKISSPEDLRTFLQV